MDVIKGKVIWPVLNHNKKHNGFNSSHRKSVLNCIWDQILSEVNRRKQFLNMYEMNRLHDLLMLDSERQKLDLLSQKKENLCYCLLKANSKVTFHTITSL